MADITDEINAFQSAIYGEDVRSAMVSLARKLNGQNVGTSNVIDYSITNSKLDVDSVTRSKILDGEVITSKIADDSITTAKLQNSSVSTEKIQNMSITVGKLGTGCVSSYKLATDSVITEKILDGAVTESKLAGYSVTENKISNGAVTNTKLAADSVTRSKILDGEVITSKIADDSITNEKLQNSSVATNNIQNMAITVGKLAQGCVSSYKLATDSVITEKISDGAVTASKLAEDSVTENKILNGSVTNPKLAADSVTRSKILDGEVITSKIADDSITTEKLQNSSISTEKIQNMAITVGKLDTECVSSYKLATDSVITEKILDGAVTASKLEESIRNRLQPTNVVTPEEFGAVGDGVTDDTSAIVAAIKTNRVVNFGIRKKYLVTGVTIRDVYNTIIYGNNSTLLMKYEGSNNRTILGFVHCTYIDVHNLRVSTDLAEDLGNSSTDISELFSYAPYGISIIDGCGSIRIIECAVGLVKDGISSNDSNRVLISHCYIRNIGQEPIAVRNTDGIIIDGNDLAWHTGDGILIKAFLYDRFYDIIVTNNRLCYPKQTTPSALGALIMGGGITINAENTDNAYLSKGIIITGNQISGCRYGIQLANVAYALVSNNVVRVNKRSTQGTYDTGSTAFGLTLDPEWAPKNPLVMTKVLFANNIGSGGFSIFKCHNNASDVPCEHIVFSNNIAEGTDLAQSRYGFDVNNATVIGNLVSNCRRNGIFINSVVIGNQFLSPWGTPTNLDESDCCLSGEKCIFNDNVVEGTQIYINCSKRSIVRNNYFELSRNDGIVVNCDNQSYSTIMGNDYGNHPLRSENIDDMSSVTGHVYTD